MVSTLLQHSNLILVFIILLRHVFLRHLQPTFATNSITILWVCLCERSSSRSNYVFFRSWGADDHLVKTNGIFQWAIFPSTFNQDSHELMFETGIFMDADN